ncbi:MAG: TonB-dependent siderophore receptor [Bryobacteraceae bacterium]
MTERKIGKKNRKRSRMAAAWPVACRWVAMGTFVIYTAVGSRTVTIAYAQDAGRALDAAAPQGQSSPARSFDIPAGSLDAVLSAFQIATGLQVRVQNEAIRSVASPGVSGVYTVQQALQRLLSNTGVSHRFTAPNVVTLELRGPAASIEVTDRIAPLSSPKYTEPLRDTPQTIMVIPKSVMEEQGALTLRDVLRNVPGITLQAGEGGVPAGDNLTMRGFSARNDLFVDGVRDLGPQSRDPFNMEQVEVTKGPTSAVSGRGSAGGTINMVSKAPNLNRYFGGSVNLGSDDTKRVTADVNLPVRRLGLGERTAFRMNFLKHESGVAGRDVVENDRWGLAPSLAMGLGTSTRMTFSYFRLEQNNVPDYGIPWVTANHNVLADLRDQPAPVPRETFYGIRGRDREKTGSDMATVRIEHDLTDSVDFRNQFRYGRSTRDSITTAPRFVSPDTLEIRRNGPSWITEDQNWDNQTDLRARFSTGGIAHSLVAGVNLNRESNLRRGRTIDAAPNTTLFNPDPNQPYDGAIVPSPNVGDVTGSTQALYAFDTVRLSQKWEATGGLRWERFDVDGVTVNLEPLSRVDTMSSLRAALIYKPARTGSLYASYGTALNPSLEGLSYQTANTNIEPEKTYTVEAGTKWDVFGERVLLSGAVFRVDKTNARTPGVLPDDPPQVLDGTQRVKGIELGITGSITRTWKVFGAYTLLDSEIAKSNNPAEVGKKFQNTPRNSFSLWTTYRFRNLIAGGGPRFIDRRYGNNTNTRVVGSYWTADAMVSYPVTSRLDLRLNLYNLNNAFYFDRLGGGHLIPGAARSVMVSTNFHF